MNFFEEFFDSLVFSYLKIFIKKKKEKKIKEETKKQIEQIKEKQKMKEKPLIIRKVEPRTFLLPPSIEKIASKELAPKQLEFKKFIPSLELEKEKIVEKKERFYFGKINDLVYNTNIDLVKINSDEKIVVIYKDGKIEEKNIIMSKEEIINLLNQISKIIKIPLEKEFRCYFEDFFIDAKINEKIFLSIKRII